MEKRDFQKLLSLPFLSEYIFCSDHDNILSPSDINIYMKLVQVGTRDKFNKEKAKFLSVDKDRYNNF